MHILSSLHTPVPTVKTPHYFPQMPIPLSPAFGPATDKPSLLLMFFIWPCCFPPVNSPVPSVDVRSIFLPSVTELRAGVRESVWGAHGGEQQVFVAAETARLSWDSGLKHILAQFFLLLLQACPKPLPRALPTVPENQPVF